MIFAVHVYNSHATHLYSVRTKEQITGSLDCHLTLVCLLFGPLYFILFSVLCSLDKNP